MMSNAIAVDFEFKIKDSPFTGKTVLIIKNCERTNEKFIFSLKPDN